MEWSKWRVRILFNCFQIAGLALFADKVFLETLCLAEIFIIIRAAAV